MIKNINQQYLNKYAELESFNLGLKEVAYDYVVVIPACNEKVNFLDYVFSLIKENCLIILVVNSPPDKKEWQKQNQELISSLHKKSKCSQYLNKSVSHHKFNSLPDVLLVDRNFTGNQIPHKQGVGLARKIGADIALKLYSVGIIKYPWIFSTDADVILPKSYFSQIHLISDNYSAVVLDFQHITDDIHLSKLQFLYDFKMRYYLVGIEYAHVGYAYIPLGSALIVSMQSYVQVRGFPKRNAGEDFYLLNKLAKVKPIKYKVESCCVKIVSRFSDRVPFGTGPALQAISELSNVDDYSYYHPECFVYLKCWKEYLDTLWNENKLLIKQPQDKILNQLYDFFDCYKVFAKSKKQITSAKRWQQFVHQWFDAFKILKAVHYVDKKLQRLNYKELLKDGTFVKVADSKLNLFIKKNDIF